MTFEYDLIQYNSIHKIKSIKYLFAVFPKTQIFEAFNNYYLNNRHYIKLFLFTLNIFFNQTSLVIG